MDISELTTDTTEDTTKTPKKENGQSLKTLINRETKFLETCREVKVKIKFEFELHC